MTKYDGKTILQLINEGKITGITKLDENMFLIQRYSLEDPTDFDGIVKALEDVGYFVTAGDDDENVALMQPERRHDIGVNMHRRKGD